MSSQSGPSENKYYRRSSGRDISNGSRLKSTDENGSSRGIIYPEDVELQSDDRSDKEIRVTIERREAPSAGLPKYGTTMDRLKLGLRPTVRTEVKVGSPAPTTAWPSAGDRGIAVKRDFIMTTGQPLS
jgi:hypothetical protein